MSAWGQLKGVPTEKIYSSLMDRYRSSDSELIVKRVCLEALGSVNSPEVSQAIEEAYESSQRELQLSAIFAMGNSADSRWLPIVLDEMESPYEEMRMEAARAAGNIGHSDAIMTLAGLAYDENEEVAVVAIAALGEIGGDTVREVLVELSEDIDLDDRNQFIFEALEESSWSDLDLQFGLFTDDFFDEEE
jgi:HEAT repeat protein